MSLLKNGKIRILLEKGIIFDEEGSYMKFQIANKARENELLFAFPKLKNSFEIYTSFKFNIEILHEIR